MIYVNDHIKTILKHFFILVNILVFALNAVTLNRYSNCDCSHFNNRLKTTFQKINTMSERKATIHDVAKVAGVSYQTVSRVINASPNVADDTRARVNAAIRTLKFQPNRVARTLITGRSRTLQLVNYNIHSPILGPILNIADRVGYRIVFSTPTNKDLRDEIADLAANQIDGFLLLTGELELTYDELREIANGIPFVVLDADLGPEAPCVLIDQHHGIRILVEHLIELGHRHFAEIRGPEKYFDSSARHESYETTLSKHGIPRGPVGRSKNFTPQTGYEAAQQLLDSGAYFTALVCANDQTAFGAMRALREHGLRVPEDVSVTGFDNDLSSDFFTPSLTTVVQDYWTLASQSLEHLISLINAPDTPPYRRVLYPRLIVRESTGPAKES